MVQGEILDTGLYISDLLQDYSLTVVLVVFIAAIIAGFVDTVAGGGGLISIPILVFAGLSPVQALGTNKFQACFGSASASLHFIRHKIIQPNHMKAMIVTVAFGAALGAYAIQQIDNSYLMMIIPFTLIAIGLYTLLAKNLGEYEQAAIISKRHYSYTAAPTVGFYDGFLGPGTGTFFTISGVKLLGMDFIKATGHAKVLNFISNIVALMIFLLSGQVVFFLGLIMATGQFMGAQLGARTVIKKGPKFIKVLTVMMCVVMSISLIYQQLASST